MKKCVLILLSLAFAFCIVTVSYASESQKAAQDFTLQQASKALQVTGAVKSVNADAGTLVITKKFRDKTIEVLAVADKGTKIVKGKEMKSLHDIRDGDKVAVVYTRKGEVNLAKSISLK